MADDATRCRPVFAVSSSPLHTTGPGLASVVSWVVTDHAALQMRLGCVQVFASVITGDCEDPPDNTQSQAYIPLASSAVYTLYSPLILRICVPVPEIPLVLTASHVTVN